MIPKSVSGKRAAADPSFLHDLDALTSAFSLAPNSKPRKPSSLWKSLKSLAYIRRRRFDCRFTLHVHSITNLPPPLADVALTVHWRRTTDSTSASTRPVRAVHGAAQFDETLSYRCSVYSSRSAVANYDPREFRIWAEAGGMAADDLGIHLVDLTRLLPLTLEELEDEGKRTGRWSTSFRLLGKARGATLSVSFTFSIIGGGLSVSGCGKVKVSEVLTNKPGKMGHCRSRSMEDVKVVHEVLPMTRSDLAELARADYADVNECQIGNSGGDLKPESEVVCELGGSPDLKPCASGEFVDGQNCKLQGMGITDEVTFSGTQSVREMVDNGGVIISETSVDPEDQVELLSGIEQGIRITDEGKFSETESPNGVCEMIDNGGVAMDNESSKDLDEQVNLLSSGNGLGENCGLPRYTDPAKSGLTDLESAQSCEEQEFSKFMLDCKLGSMLSMVSRSLSLDVATEFEPSAKPDEEMLESLGHDSSLTESSVSLRNSAMEDLDIAFSGLSIHEWEGVESPQKEAKSCTEQGLRGFKTPCGRMGRSLGLNGDTAESVASEFLSMLGIEHSPFRLSSDSDSESPKEHLWKQFDKDTLSIDNSIFGLDEGTGRVYGWGDFSEDFDLASIVLEAETELEKTAQGVDSKSRAKMLEDAETEALMREWGLNEKAFQNSPPGSRGGFGSPINLPPEVPLDLPPLGEGLGPILQTKDGGFVRSMSPSLFKNAKNHESLIMQVSSPVVVPAEMGSGIMDILQGLASVGIEKLSGQAKKLMPLEDISGKTMQQVAWQVSPNVETCERQEFLQHPNPDACGRRPGNSVTVSPEDIEIGVDVGAVGIGGLQTVGDAMEVEIAEAATDTEIRDEGLAGGSNSGGGLIELVESADGELGARTDVNIAETDVVVVGGNQIEGVQVKLVAPALAEVYDGAEQMEKAESCRLEKPGVDGDVLPNWHLQAADNVKEAGIGFDVAIENLSVVPSPGTTQGPEALVVMDGGIEVGHSSAGDYGASISMTALPGNDQSIEQVGGSISKGGKKNVRADSSANMTLNIESSLDTHLMHAETDVLKKGLPEPDGDEVLVDLEAEQRTLRKADVIADDDTHRLGDHELMDSSDKQIPQHAPVVPWTLYSKSNQRACYNLPPQDETQFSVTDLVWGKVKSYPWWPGQIFDPLNASKLALKHKKKDNFLIAYFGDGTFAWRDKHQLKPFCAGFSKMEKQSSSDAFVIAVNEGLGEVSRKMESGMACSCIAEQSADGKCQKFEHAAIKEGTNSSFRDRALAVNYFDCSRLVEYIKALAQMATGGADRLDLLIAKAQLKAFYRVKGYPELPEFTFGRGLMENDVEVSASLNQKPEESAVENSIPLSSELVPVKRKRGRPPKNVNVVLNDVEASASMDKSPKEFDIEDSATLSELIIGTRKRGRPLEKKKNILNDVEISAKVDKKSKEFVNEHSTPSSSELITVKRKSGRPPKKQIHISENVGKEKSLAEVMEEKNVSLRHKSMRLLSNVSSSSGKKFKVVESDSVEDSESKFDSSGKRKRGRPPKKPKDILDDAGKRKSLSEVMEEKIVSCLHESGSGMKSDSLLSNLRSSSSGKKLKVTKSYSNEDSKNDSDAVDLRKPTKRKLDLVSDMGSNPASPNLRSSFEESIRDSKESKRQRIKFVVDLEKKSRSPTVNSSFKIGEYIRRGASRLTELPPIVKYHGDTSQTHKLEGVDTGISPAPVSKRRTKADLTEDSSSDDKPGRKTRGRRGRKKMVEFESHSSDMSSPNQMSDSDWSDENTYSRSRKRRVSNARKRKGEMVLRKRRAKKKPSVRHDEMLSQLRLAASDPMKGYIFLSTVISFFTDFRDSCASTPDYMKDSYWSDIITVNNSEQGHVSKDLKQQKTKKKLDSARHLQFGAASPNMKPALATERPIITVEEKVVDTPTALILNFNSVESLPSEADLIKIFGGYGPLKDTQIEVMTKINRAKVVFKRRADAEIAFSSGKFSTFGQALLSYQLKYLPSAPKVSPDSHVPIKGDNFEVSALEGTEVVFDTTAIEGVREETGLVTDAAPVEAVREG